MARIVSLIFRRQLHTSIVCHGFRLRVEKGLPRNRTSSGPLTDLPDYTFLDGRVTPIGSRRKQRMIERHDLAKQIIQGNKEIDFAKQRIINMKQAEEKRRAFIEENFLKQKGGFISRKKTMLNS